MVHFMAFHKNGDEKRAVRLHCPLCVWIKFRLPGSGRWSGASKAHPAQDGLWPVGVVDVIGVELGFQAEAGASSVNRTVFTLGSAFQRVAGIELHAGQGATCMVMPVAGEVTSAVGERKPIEPRRAKLWS